MITLDPNIATAPSAQIQTQISDLIRSGELAPGHRLPAIRQLAADLRTAPGTVAKAYSTLEANGLVESSRARGTRVLAGAAHHGAVLAASQDFVTTARARGLGLDEALGAIRRAWAEGAAT